MGQPLQKGVIVRVIQVYYELKLERPFNLVEIASYHEMIIQLLVNATKLEQRDARATG